MTPEGAVGEVLAALDAERVPGPLAVAVSGGGDSMALLHATVLASRRGVVAATVDHGLRPGSHEEAEGVARACATLGVPHEVLRWDGAGRGNLQERAREARRRLLGGWARRNGAAAVLLGHTADDQAETVLLRLARGSGVDGLSGMPASFDAEGMGWSRPFLGLGREELRDWLRARDIAWVEDPSNEDPRFDRARARAMLERLGELGLTRDRLVRTAGHMARARVSLEGAARTAAARTVQEEGADLLLPISLLREFDQSDSAGRILAAALQWVGGSERRPRWEALRRLASVAAAGRGATLAGCLIRPEGDLVRIAPESGRATAPSRDPGRSFAGTARFG